MEETKKRSSYTGLRCFVQKKRRFECVAQGDPDLYMIYLGNRAYIQPTIISSHVQEIVLCSGAIYNLPSDHFFYYHYVLNGTKEYHNHFIFIKYTIL
jgi:hypothetical protein